MRIPKSVRINISGPRGLLANYSDDVIFVINGLPITKTDILNVKRERQARQLALKRRTYEPITRPCFVWTFWTNGLGETGFFRGWWLYIKTLHESWIIDPRYRTDLTLKVMRLYPCGYLPMIENFNPWKAAFAATYPYPTKKRPDRQGMVIARAKISSNGAALLDIISCRLHVRVG